MSTIHILAIGKIRQGPMAEAIAEYQKRMRWKLVIKEFDLKDSNPAKLQAKESEALLAAVPDGARIIALDPRGKELESPEFAKRISNWQNESQHLAFLIGGADGHTDMLRKKADFLLSFGKMTWPHMMARAMLVEQLYRAQQILAGHPYHRE